MTGRALGKMDFAECLIELEFGRRDGKDEAISDVSLRAIPARGCAAERLASHLLILNRAYKIAHKL